MPAPDSKLGYRSRRLCRGGHHLAPALRMARTDLVVQTVRSATGQDSGIYSLTTSCSEGGSKRLLDTGSRCTTPTRGSDDCVARRR